ncbi:MAG TPA: HD domain-containing phosphohydrolase [Gemmataceae bacterium]|jgi:HD-GYP domain-containing protein (c-di-GMP phosphodiesterase class II)
MDSPKIVLVTTAASPVTWTSSSQLQIGRLPDLDVSIDDPSISRRHAEILLVDEGWVVRDFGSTNGTYLNRVRIGRTPQKVRQGDELHVGSVALRVEYLRNQAAVIRIGDGQTVQVQALAKRSWDQAVEGFELSDEQWPKQGQHFVRLMRSGYLLAHAASPDEQLRQVLEQAVVFFGAQRGGIFLADEGSGHLAIRCIASPPDRPLAARTISRTTATRAFNGQKSLLFKDCREPDLMAAESVTRGAMNSIICAVLRSPERTFGVLHLDRGLLQEPFAEGDLYLADSLAAALALGVERIQMVDRQQELFLHTVTALAQAVEMRDLYTGNHTHRVTTYALILAEELGVKESERQVLRAAAALHDIGKIAIDDHILRKPGRLSETEFTQMKMHVIRGSEIIQMVPGLSWAQPVVRGHHERWDGTGYPDRLKGEEIPLLARVVSVADAFDAMTSDRPYRPGMSIATAYAELQSGAGKQFDPTLIDAFVRVRPRIEALFEQESALREQHDAGTDTVSSRELKRQAMEETPGPGPTPSREAKTLATIELPPAACPA